MRQPDRIASTVNGHDFWELLEDDETNVSPDQVAQVFRHEGLHLDLRIQHDGCPNEADQIGYGLGKRRRTLLGYPANWQ